MPKLSKLLASLNRKQLTGFTLVELLVAVSLLGLILVGVASFEYFTTNVFMASQKKGIVLNDMTFVLEHIQKYIWQGRGDEVTPAFKVSGGGNNYLLEIEREGQPFCNYTFDFDKQNVVFRQNGSEEVLISRLYNDAGNLFFMAEEEDGIVINNLTLIYNPSQVYHLRRNPKTRLDTSYFYSYNQRPESTKMILSSPNFLPGENLPDFCACADPQGGSDENPQLNIFNPPDGTKSFALVVEDPDAPDPANPKYTWIHWVLYNIDDTITQIDKGGVPSGATEGVNTCIGAGCPEYSFKGYAGVCPPEGTHRYFFKLYALSLDPSDPRLPANLNREQLKNNIAGYILGEAELVGRRSAP